VGVDLIVRPVLRLQPANLGDLGAIREDTQELVFLLRHRGVKPAQARVRWRLGRETHVWSRMELSPDSTSELRLPLPPLPPGLALPVEVWAAVPGHSALWQGWLSSQAENPLLYDFVQWVSTAVVGSELRDGQVLLGDENTGGHFQAATLACGGEQMPGIFAHPPWKNGVGAQFGRYALALPSEPALLKFAIGLCDGSTSEDGVVFRITADSGEGPRVIYERQWNERRWLEQSVSLAEYAGKAVQIAFVTDVGPNDNSVSDWACWGAPRIEAQTPKTRVLLTSEPAPTLAIPPENGVPSASAEHLARAVSAELLFETAGVNEWAPYVSYVYLNGVALGQTPGSESDTEWTPARLPLPLEALKALRARSEVQIRNPSGDCFKLRRLRLNLVLDDGTVVQSWVTAGPFSSDAGWLHAEGQGVSLGQPLSVPLVLFPDGG